MSTAIEAKAFGLGELRVNTKSDDGTVKVKCDRMAVDEYGCIYLLSVVGDANAVKKVGAALHTKASGGVEYDHAGLEFFRPDGHQKYFGNRALRASEYGYKRTIHKLRYGKVHAVFVSKSPLFLVSVSGESLWRRLNGRDFTTPILRPWMKYITKKLIEDGQLRYCYGHRAKCGTLLCGTDTLDKIVSEGIRAGALPFDDRMPPKLAGCSTN